MNKQEFNALKILHVAFSIGTTAILLINHFLIKKVAFNNLNTKIDTKSLVVIGLGTALAFLSVIIFKKMITTSVETPSDVQIRKAYILKWGLLECGAILSLLFFFFLNGHQLTLVSGLTLLLLLILSGPKESNFI